MARNIFARFTRGRQPKVEATLDGLALKRVFTAGFHWLERHKEYINALNVYPVPDGDTGKNMTLTMAAAVKVTASEEDASAADFMEKFSRGALMGARGNSGSILSQSLRGFSKSITGKDRISPADFAAALQEGSRAAYQCVEKPVEGTILTVSRESADAAVQAATGDVTFIQMLEEMVRAGKVAVEHTPEQLQKLKDAGVVDAGGQGYVTVYEGVLRALKGEPVEPLSHAEREQIATGHKGAVEIEEEFGYEVVFLLRGENLDLDAIRRTINAMGGVSTVVAGDGQMLKVHTHVPMPGKVLDYGVSLGSLIDINIENLQEQSLEYADQSARERGLPGLDLHAAAQNGARPTAPEAPAERLPIGVVTVAAGDGWARLFESYRLGGVVSGGQTMNPSTEELLRAVEACPSDAVIILPNNRNILMSARQVAGLTAKQVAVVPSDSMPQGVSALLAFNHQADFAANAAAMERALSAVGTGEITRAVRAVTMDGVAVNEGDLIGLADGKLAASGHDLDQIMRDLLAKMDAPSHEIITLFPGQETSPTDAEAMASRVRVWFPSQEVETQRGDQPYYPYIVAVE
ncbi:MAG TPA: DAK2 domain-containing protein [Ktedonobacterales bacterium]